MESPFGTLELAHGLQEELYSLGHARAAEKEEEKRLVAEPELALERSHVEAPPVPECVVDGRVAYGGTPRIDGGRLEQATPRVLGIAHEALEAEPQGEALQHPRDGGGPHAHAGEAPPLAAEDLVHGEDGGNTPQSRGEPGGEGRGVQRGVDETRVPGEGQGPREAEEGEEVPRGEGRRGHADHAHAPHRLPRGRAGHAGGEDGDLMPVGGQRARQLTEERLSSAHVGREVLEDEEDTRVGRCRCARRGRAVAHGVAGSSRRCAKTMPRAGRRSTWLSTKQAGTRRRERRPPAMRLARVRQERAA